VGDAAEATVTSKFEPGVAYDIDLSSVTLPWGETKTAALAVPTLRVKPDLAEQAHDDHDGHSHPHAEHGHDQDEEHRHPHDEHGHDHHDRPAHDQGHDHAHGDHVHVAVSPRVRDVVCGMMIEPAAAAASSLYKGETYYFCAMNCKQKFDADPTQYVKSKGLLARLFGRF
jgi:YHS domain-containing protein